MEASKTGNRSRVFVLYSTFLLLVVAAAVCTVGCFGVRIEIDLAQSAINLQSTIEEVTFHTNIKWSLVDCEGVSLTVLNLPSVTVAVDSCTSDSRGYLKAHFLMQNLEEIRSNLKIDREKPFLLKGRTTDGTLFWGMQDILVVDP
jgi:hypothetical protein